MYLEPSQTFTMKFFYKNSELLKTVDNFYEGKVQVLNILSMTLENLWVDLD